MRVTCRLSLTDERHDQLVQRMRPADAAQLVRMVDEAIGVGDQVLGAHLNRQRNGRFVQNVLWIEWACWVEYIYNTEHI